MVFYFYFHLDFFHFGVRLFFVLLSIFTLGYECFAGVSTEICLQIPLYFQGIQRATTVSSNVLLPTFHHHFWSTTGQFFFFFLWFLVSSVKCEHILPCPASLKQNKRTRVKSGYSTNVHTFNAFRHATESGEALKEFFDSHAPEYVNRKNKFWFHLKVLLVMQSSRLELPYFKMIFLLMCTIFCYAHCLEFHILLARFFTKLDGLRWNERYL